MTSSTAHTFLWGSGTGPLKSLSPQTRIMSGVFLGAACLAVPLTTPHAAIAASLITIAWCALAGMPPRIALGCACIALALFLPLMLLTPWIAIDPASQSPVVDRLRSAGAIALRSTCCLFVAAATIAALPLHDVYHGVTRTPIPRPIALLIVQIITQTMLLMEETMRVIAVLRLRAGSGVRGVRLPFAFPVTWMVRILFRAERTAAAMTVRGYGAGDAVAEPESVSSHIDTLAVVLAIALAAAAIILRMESLR